MKAKSWYAALLEIEDPEKVNDLLLDAVKHLSRDVSEREGQEAAIEFVIRLAAMSLSNLVVSGGLGHAESRFQLLALGLAVADDFKPAEAGGKGHLVGRELAGEVMH